jgi:ketosteroid isomerase-like protein
MPSPVRQPNRAHGLCFVVAPGQPPASSGRSAPRSASAFVLAANVGHFRLGLLLMIAVSAGPFGCVLALPAHSLHDADRFDTLEQFRWEDGACHTVRQSPNLITMFKTVLFLFTLRSTIAFAAELAPKEAAAQLTETIAQMDAKMFAAFNAHDVDLLMSMFTPDVEFYQDNDGVSNYEQTKNDLAKMFANVPDIKRELVKGTLEVYPIKDYGAIEVGTHRFCHNENGKEDCGSFKFVHVWRKSGEIWKISRVISYGH